MWKQFKAWFDRKMYQWECSIGLVEVSRSPSMNLYHHHQAVILRVFRCLQCDRKSKLQNLKMAWTGDGREYLCCPYCLSSRLIEQAIPALEFKGRGYTL